MPVVRASCLEAVGLEDGAVVQGWRWRRCVVFLRGWCASGRATIGAWVGVVDTWPLGAAGVRCWGVVNCWESGVRHEEGGYA